MSNVWFRTAEARDWPPGRDKSLAGMHFEERLAKLDTLDRDPGVISVETMLWFQATRLVQDTIRYGHAGSVADVERMFRDRMSRVYLAAGTLLRGITNESYSAAGHPTMFTYLVQDPDTLPEYSLRFKLSEQPWDIPEFEDGISYDENLARLATTGVVIDLIDTD